MRHKTSFLKNILKSLNQFRVGQKSVSPNFGVQSFRILTSKFGDNTDFFSIQQVPDSGYDLKFRRNVFNKQQKKFNIWHQNLLFFSFILKFHEQKKKILKNMIFSQKFTFFFLFILISWKKRVKLLFCALYTVVS